jgi:glycosyltransferase involved in cell wall biosynthesis
LQKGEMTIRATEDTREPFIVAMGSANRDYGTLLAAIEGTGIPLTIVAAQRCIAHLRIPENVTHLHDLTHAACLELAARARISVIPLLDVDAASGQVTFLEAMRLGRPVITTRSPGTEDYITDGQTGLLVPVGDSGSLRDAIHSLWTDEARRQSLADAARYYAQAHFSDEAVAVRLRQILLEIERVIIPQTLAFGSARRGLPWR